MRQKELDKTAAKLLDELTRHNFQWIYPTQAPDGIAFREYAYSTDGVEYKVLETIVTYTHCGVEQHG